MAKPGAWGAVVVGTALVGAPACDAKINAFTAAPDHVCAGTPVTLIWSVKGTAHMQSEAATGGPNGETSSSDTATIHPTGSGRIELHATRFLGAATTSWQDIWFDTLAPPLTIGVDDRSGATCDAATGITATAELSGSAFAPDMTVTEIAPRDEDRHQYSVTHANHATVVVDPTAQAPAHPWNADLAGTPVIGVWTLQAKLLPGETCGTATLPRSLGVQIYTACPGGK